MAAALCFVEHGGVVVSRVAVQRLMLKGLPLRAHHHVRVPPRLSFQVVGRSSILHPVPRNVVVVTWAAARRNDVVKVVAADEFVSLSCKTHLFYGLLVEASIMIIVLDHRALSMLRRESLHRGFSNIKQADIAIKSR
jgi:hypothetical protein